GLALGAEDGSVWLCPTDTLAAQRLPGGHRAAVGWLVFGPGDRSLFSAAVDGSVRLWDVARRRERLLLRGAANVPAFDGIHLSADGQVLIMREGRENLLRWHAPRDAP